MAKNTFIFTKEMAELLSKIHKKAGLSQKEVAEKHCGDTYHLLMLGKTIQIHYSRQSK